MYTVYIYMYVAILYIYSYINLLSRYPHDLGACEPSMPRADITERWSNGRDNWHAMGERPGAVLGRYEDIMSVVILSII